jgi:osmotically-inducible protein OsmY
MHTPRFHLMVGTSMLAAIALLGCDRAAPPQTAGQRVDTVIEKTQDKLEDIKTSAANAAKTTSRALDDTAITAGVKAGLAGDPDLKTLDIRVETKDGRTSLHGSAPNAAARDRAQQIASAVTGVISVDNQLAIKP